MNWLRFTLILMANMMFSRQPRWPCRILAQPSGGPFLGHDGLGGWEAGKSAGVERTYYKDISVYMV